MDADSEALREAAILVLADSDSEIATDSLALKDRDSDELSCL